MAFLISYFSDEFKNFLERSVTYHAPPTAVQHAIQDSLFLRAARASEDVRESDTGNGQTAHSGAFAMSRNLMLRKWASLRMQTLYRTISGMMRNQQALEVLLRIQLPHLREKELLALLKTKFTCLAALQRYHVMPVEERADGSCAPPYPLPLCRTQVQSSIRIDSHRFAVEVLLTEFPLLTIAYLETQQDGNNPPRFFSCLVDGSCKVDHATHMRRPKFRVELPGHPILGNGKSDKSLWRGSNPGIAAWR